MNGGYGSALVFRRRRIDNPVFWGGPKMWSPFPVILTNRKLNSIFVSLRHSLFEAGVGFISVSSFLSGFRGVFQSFQS